MPVTYQNPRYAYRRPDAVGRAGPEEAPVVIAGGGLVGLTLALDLARRGTASVLLDEDDTVSFGSRAICWAKRTLEIMGRLGLGQRFLDKGITWNQGRVYVQDREAYAFDLLPEQGHEFPAFVNLQQYYAEEWLVAACEATGLVDLRWKNRVASVERRPDGALLGIETPDGPYRLHAQWLLACDGARSLAREQLGLEFLGQVFRDRFLIADIVMRAPFPAERRFWFDPPFHPGQSVLLHKQPDDVWRIDFQLGWDADPEEEKRPEKVRARVAQMLGEDIPFELEWVSVYTFRCRRLERFRHGRILFVGDSAHQVSPFGARGGNGGVQDADNLAWKLDAVLRGAAPEALLDSYDAERIPAAEENILNSTRSTDFITPKNGAARAYRDAVLALTTATPAARPWVNSGRLSRPAVLRGSPLGTPGGEDAPLPPGAPAVDAPVLNRGRADWLLRHLGGTGFTLLALAGEGAPPPEAPPGIARLVVGETETTGGLFDHAGLVARRWGLAPGEAVLLRPDQHVAARFAVAETHAIAAAHRRAMGHAA
ncbi:FAD-dependent oxidoreductase [Paracraurococcus ruber]|uniref:FAD-dependent oxidoreductase n=1 Tax=Paracraurococcus ruber TaxID=77675 RepID=A0ABS1CSV7_9PROT|nr:FAD-dependent oxidoreductase [Paracraurococcus ruber]MBK1657077.1 FAD-dependent oxidoreductase [Paracraurococcus ruber]TDG33376.1 FAD-dependent oxidoreductase [Paracraurococcus ruber]